MLSITNWQTDRPTDQWTDQWTEWVIELCAGNQKLCRLSFPHCERKCVVCKNCPKSSGKRFKKSFATMNIRIGSFWANIVFKHFLCSIYISRAQSNWKINMDMIKAQHHQCCCCVELITRVLREISSIVFLYNVSIDEGVPRSSSNWLSNWALDMQMMDAWIWCFIQMPKLPKLSQF